MARKGKGQLEIGVSLNSGSLKRVGSTLKANGWKAGQDFGQQWRRGAESEIAKTRTKPRGGQTSSGSSSSSGSGGGGKSGVVSGAVAGTIAGALSRSFGTAGKSIAALTGNVKALSSAVQTAVNEFRKFSNSPFTSKFQGELDRAARNFSKTVNRISGAYGINSRVNNNRDLNYKLAVGKEFQNFAQKAGLERSSASYALGRYAPKVSSQHIYGGQGGIPTSSGSFGVTPSSNVTHTTVAQRPYTTPTAAGNPKNFAIPQPGVNAGQVFRTSAGSSSVTIANKASTNQALGSLLIGQQGAIAGLGINNRHGAPLSAIQQGIFGSNPRIAAELALRNSSVSSGLSLAAFPTLAPSSMSFRAAGEGLNFGFNGATAKKFYDFNPQKVEEIARNHTQGRYGSTQAFSFGANGAERLMSESFAAGFGVNPSAGFLSVEPKKKFSRKDLVFNPVGLETGKAISLDTGGISAGTHLFSAGTSFSPGTTIVGNQPRYTNGYNWGGHESSFNYPARFMQVRPLNGKTNYGFTTTAELLRTRAGYDVPSKAYSSSYGVNAISVNPSKVSKMTVREVAQDLRVAVNGERSLAAANRTLGGAAGNKTLPGANIASLPSTSAAGTKFGPSFSLGINGAKNIPLSPVRGVGDKNYQPSSLQSQAKTMWQGAKKDFPVTTYIARETSLIGRSWKKHLYSSLNDVKNGVKNFNTSTTNISKSTDKIFSAGGKLSKSGFGALFNPKDKEKVAQAKMDLISLGQAVKQGVKGFSGAISNAFRVAKGSLSLWIGSPLKAMATPFTAGARQFKNGLAWFKEKFPGTTANIKKAFSFCGSAIVKGASKLTSSLMGFAKSLVSTTLSVGSMALPVVGMAAGYTSMKAGREETALNVAATRGKWSDTERSEIQALERKVAEGSTSTMADVQAITAELVKSGRSVPEIKNLLPTVNQFALSSGMEKGEAANMLTGIMGGLQLNAAQMPEFANLMTTAAGVSNTSAAEMGQAMKYVGNSAGRRGISPLTVLAELGSLADVGISSDMAGTTLRGAYTRWDNAEAEAIRKQTGISWDTMKEKGAARTISMVIDRLKELGKTEEEINQIMEGWLGLRVTNIQSVRAERIDEKEAKIKSMATGENGRSYMENVANAQMSGIGGMYEKIKSQFDVWLTKIGEELNELFGPFIENFAKYDMADVLDLISGAVMDVVGIVQGILSVLNVLLNALASGLGMLWDFMKELIKTVMTAVVAVVDAIPMVDVIDEDKGETAESVAERWMGNIGRFSKIFFDELKGYFKKQENNLTGQYYYEKTRGTHAASVEELYKNVHEQNSKYAEYLKQRHNRQFSEYSDDELAEFLDTVGGHLADLNARKEDIDKQLHYYEERKKNAGLTPEDEKRYQNLQALNAHTDKEIATTQGLLKGAEAESQQRTERQQGMEALVRWYESEQDRLDKEYDEKQEYNRQKGIIDKGPSTKWGEATLNYDGMHYASAEEIKRYQADPEGFMQQWEENHPHETFVHDGVLRKEMADQAKENIPGMVMAQVNKQLQEDVKYGEKVNGTMSAYEVGNLGISTEADLGKLSQKQLKMQEKIYKKLVDEYNKTYDDHVISVN